MGLSKKIVWLIDDDAEDAKTYQQLLGLDGSLTVRQAKVEPNVADYRVLASDPDTGAVVLDERLSDYSGVNYLGLSAANELRTFYPSLPIYLLTQYAGTIPPDSGQPVEAIIAKSELRANPILWSKRMLRSISRYEDSLNEKQRRLRELITLRLAGDLTQEQEVELEKLRTDIEVPFEPIVTNRERARLDRIREQHECLEELRRIVNRLPGGSRPIGGDQQVGQ
jgi:hypothetical protein